MTAEALPWVKEGKRQRCTLHGCTFAKTDVCKTCTAVKDRTGVRSTKDPLPRPPAGCMSSVQLERWFVALAKKSANDAELVSKAYPFAELTTPPAIIVIDKDGPHVHVRDFHDEGAIAKHRDNAIKAMRAAAELALRREDDAIVDKRHAEINARRKGASH